MKIEVMGFFHRIIHIQGGSSTFYPSLIPLCLCGLDEFSRLLTFTKREKVISSNVRNQGDSVAICQGSDCELKDRKFMKT